MSEHAARRPFYPCMSCSYSTVYDWDTRMVRCELSGESGQAAEVDCLSYAKRRNIIDWVSLARKKVKR